MDIQNFLMDVAKLAGGGSITVAAGYYLVRADIQRYLELKSLETKKEDRSQLLLLRLQAHERLILFIERINPSSVMIRLHQQGISLAAMQSLLLNEIRSEYQHNVSQQLYVSSAVWNMVVKLKDDTMVLINNAVKGMPEGAEGVDLSRKILHHMSGIADNPYNIALDLIKKDIHKLF